MNTPTRNHEAPGRQRARRRLPLALIAAMLVATLPSCTDDLSVTPDEASTDRVPVLQTSSDAVVLDLSGFGQTAVTFTWSPGSNHGTSMAVDYVLEFDAGGETFDAPVAVEMGRKVYAKTYSVEAFNAFLTERLGLDPGAGAEVHVRVRSATADPAIAPDYSNVVRLTATPYAPVTPTLYLIGSAAPNGWDATQATALDPDPGRPFVFTYQGNLAAGEFKFITTLGSFLPSYNRGAGEDRLVLRTDEGEPDDKFAVTEPGPYRVTANLATMTVAVEKMAGPAFEQLWVVGSAVPSGWDLDNAAEMRQDPGDPFLFDYNEVLAEGEFKIATAKSWDAPFYRPTQNYPALSDPSVQLSAGDPDHKWYISEPGPYKITLDIRDMTISIERFTPYERLWMVGDATPSGWNIDSPTELQATADPYVFTYEGALGAGEFKFPVATGDWGTDYFMPAVNHPPLEETYVRFIPGGNPDNKWAISSAGRYRITLNQLYETILVERQ